MIRCQKPQRIEPKNSAVYIFVLSSTGRLGSLCPTRDSVKSIAAAMLFISLRLYKGHAEEG